VTFLSARPGRTVTRKTEVRSYGKSEAIALAVFVLVFLALTVSTFSQKSAIWDEPLHLTPGYLALREGDYRLYPEHPPLLRIWCAVPLLLMRGVRLDNTAIDITPPGRWDEHDQVVFSQHFLYRWNDADRLLFRARFMTALLGILLGAVLFAWSREISGFWPAAIALGLYAIEPNILAHSSVVTTDLGVACFIFAAIYFLWRASGRLSISNFAAAAICTGLAVVAKFSALLLAVVVPALLTARAIDSRIWPITFPGRASLAASTSRAKALTSLLVCLVVAVIAWGVIWAVYGFRHAPSNIPHWMFAIGAESARRASYPVRVMQWLDTARLLPNAYTEGLRLAPHLHVSTAYLGGQFSTDGWWYYFPVAFVIKTPVALLVLFAAGVAFCIRRWRTIGGTEAFLLLPPAFYMAAAMLYPLNIGLRHILPIYPFVVLIASVAVAHLLDYRRRTATVLIIGLSVAAVIETGRVFPHYLAFFNALVGGPSEGSRYLLDSNLDWGQDLKLLARWTKENGVDRINLAYFGIADPHYYGVSYTPLKVWPQVDATAPAEPQLPGYVAVSETTLHGVYAPPAERDYYRPLLDLEPEAIIGYSIRVYRVDRPWTRKQ
jgi:Dolichyl-phosphate-mannose-protein mannosyltransferase